MSRPPTNVFGFIRLNQGCHTKKGASRFLLLKQYKTDQNDGKPYPLLENTGKNRLVFTHVMSSIRNKSRKLLTNQEKPPKNLAKV